MQICFIQQWGKTKSHKVINMTVFQVGETSFNTLTTYKDENAIIHDHHHPEVRANVLSFFVQIEIEKSTFPFWDIILSG